MGKKIEELDKVITLMEKTKKLFVVGVLNAEVTEDILETCRATVYAILKPVMTEPAQPETVTQTAPEESVEPEPKSKPVENLKPGNAKKKRH